MRSSPRSWSGSTGRCRRSHESATPRSDHRSGERTGPGAGGATGPRRLTDRSANGTSANDGRRERLSRDRPAQLMTQPWRRLGSGGLWRALLRPPHAPTEVMHPAACVLRPGIHRSTFREDASAFGPRGLRQRPRGAFPSTIQRSAFRNSHLVTVGSRTAWTAAGAVDAILPVSRL